MPKMICTDCQVEYDIKKNGVYVIEMFSDPPRPYKIWSADLWYCPVCDHQTIAGFGFDPIAEHFQDSFDHIIARVKQSGNYFMSYEKKPVKAGRLRNE